MLHSRFDGRNAYNPVRGVERPVEPKPSANDVPLDHILRVFDAFEERVLRWNRGWKTLARFRVLAATGMRHSQVMRLRPEDIRLDESPPCISVRQPGKEGRPHWKPLTAEGVKALREFIDAKAFGRFSAQSIRKSWILACETAGVPYFNPYRLRHTFATTLRRHGLDLADVQELLGHTSAETTKRYARPSQEKLTRAVTALDKAWKAAKEKVSSS